MTPAEPPCPFCEIVAGRAPADWVLETEDVFSIVPLNPIVPGHLLVLPKEHVQDFTESFRLTDLTARAAAHLARSMGPVNLITSKGREATQSVFHLHMHLVPRAANDGLALPWYSGKTKHAAGAQS